MKKVCLAVVLAVLMLLVPAEGFASCASRYASCSRNFSRCKASTTLAGRWITIHSAIWTCTAASGAVALGTVGASPAGAVSASVATSAVCGYTWVLLERWVQSTYSAICTTQYHNCMQRASVDCRCCN